jgi:hypothetical protein
MMILGLVARGTPPFVKNLTVLAKFGGLEVSEEQLFDRPIDISAGRAGRIYVLDSKGNNIKIFKEDGAFMGTVGRGGSGPGEFTRPWKLETIEDELYVTDTGNGRIQVLDEDGRYKTGFKVSVSFGDGMAFDSAGRVYLNTRGFRSPKLISIYDTQGNLVKEFGDLEGRSIQFFDFTVIKKQIRGGKIPDSFKNEIALIVDRGGNTFAVHQALKKLKKFSPNGELIKEHEIMAEEYESIYETFLQKNREVENSPATYYGLSYISDLGLDGDGNLYVLLNEPSRMVIYVYSNKGEFVGKLLGIEDSISRIAISHDNKLYALGNDTHFIYKFSLDLK